MTKPMLIIGNKNYSSWSLRGWLALTMAGIEFEEKLIPLFEEDHAEKMAETPAGKVPVLLDGDQVIWESLAICEYVAEMKPEANMWPSDPAQRSHARSISAEMASSFFGLRGEFPMNCRKNIGGITPSPDAQKDITRIQEIWRDCRERYGDRGPFLFGPFTAADAMYAPVVLRFETYGILVDKTCRDYMKALLNLSAIRQWKTAGAAEPWIIEEDEV